jgi:hypothetical protein
LYLNLSITAKAITIMDANPKYTVVQIPALTHQVPRRFEVGDAFSVC